MAYGRTNHQPGENWQDNRSHGYYWDNNLPWPFRQRYPDNGPQRSPPREMPFRQWNPLLKRWHQGPVLLNNFKPNKYFTRPHDGKRAGPWGRFKDALTGEGADVFVTSSGDKRTLMRDRPQRWQWAGWNLTDDEVEDKLYHDRDARWQDFEGIKEHGLAWKGRAAEPYYNFRNRHFESAARVAGHPQKVWTDAYWAPGARHGSRLPLSMRYLGDQWVSRVPGLAGMYPSGRPRW